MSSLSPPSLHLSPSHLYPHLSSPPSLPGGCSGWLSTLSLGLLEISAVKGKFFLVSVINGLLSVAY